jgi:hypothetical protein
MIDPHWFQKKWGVKEETPINEILNKLKELEARVEELERENIETTNSMYEIANSLEARIDILASEPYKLPKDVKKLQ